MAHTTPAGPRTRGARRRQAVRAAAPIAGLLLAGVLVWQGSNAAFTATTDNNGNAWETGQLALENNGGGTTFSGTTTALFDEDLLVPGDSGTKCITVESTSNVAGDLHFYATGLSGDLIDDQLELDVEVATVADTVNVAADCVDFPTTSTTIHSGPLSSLAGDYAGSSATAVALTGTAPERVAYRLSWTLVSGTDDDLIQGAIATADFNWELQSS